MVNTTAAPSTGVCSSQTLVWEATAATSTGPLHSAIWLQPSAKSELALHFASPWHRAAEAPANQLTGSWMRPMPRDRREAQRDFTGADTLKDEVCDSLEVQASSVRGRIHALTFSFLLSRLPRSSRSQTVQPQMLNLNSLICLRDASSTKYKSNLHTFQRFQELIKSTASTLKFDKDLANSEWNMVDKAIVLQNPFALSQEETTEHEKLKCPSCNKEIDETLTIEAMDLASNLLLSAQIASYQRQYKSEILPQNAVLVLVGASECFGEKKGEYINPETIKKYSESKNLLGVFRKILLNLLYNTKKEKAPSRYPFLLICHNIVSIDEFEYIGFLAILMNTFPIIISWVPLLNDIYGYEIRYANGFFLVLYILEAALKIAAMQKEYFSYTWNIFELAITFIGIIDLILFDIRSISYNFVLSGIMETIPLLRILRLLKLIAPKLLGIIDKKMSHRQSFRYAILKGYIQGEIDVMNIIDEIATSKQVKEMLLKQETRNMNRAMKELGYLEYDHPESVTMKTKEEINVMLNIAKEILKSFGTKGIIHKNDSAEISKLIMTKKKEVHDFQSIIKPLTVEEIPYHIPWLEKNQKNLPILKESAAKIVTFDCGNYIFQEKDEPKGVYIIISGMVKLQRTKSDSETDHILLESEEKAYPIVDTDYVLGGETIGELNCLTNEPMQYSATCKTVVEQRPYTSSSPGTEDLQTSERTLCSRGTIHITPYTNVIPGDVLCAPRQLFARALTVTQVYPPKHMYWKVRC
ncbi:LOW QUALITY PROTEIN: solute carrier family 9 member C1-like [Erethizon dorsatum]